MDPRIFPNWEANKLSTHYEWALFLDLQEEVNGEIQNSCQEVENRNIPEELIRSRFWQQANLLKSSFEKLQLLFQKANMNTTEEQSNYARKWAEKFVSKNMMLIRPRYSDYPKGTSQFAVHIYKNSLQRKPFLLQWKNGVYTWLSDKRKVRYKTLDQALDGKGLATFEPAPVPDAEAIESFNFTYFESRSA